MIGTKLSNRYEILRELGRGGMGVVYLARDPLLEREVAIKLLTPKLLSTEAEERFKREARVVAKMDHPAIVAVHDIGEHDGSLFFVMPFVPGTSLRHFIRDGSLNLGEVIDLGIQVADALEYSHSHGVVHRDIKPENIMVARGPAEGEIRARVTDFGLAMASTESRLTKTGTVVGTVSYLSPEQVSADVIDHRSDIYSLGTVLYECLVGSTPFSGEIQKVLYRIAHEFPQAPRSLGIDVQEDLEEIIMRCLEKDPGRRPQHAREVADTLKRYRLKMHDSERNRSMLSFSTMKTTMEQQRPVQHLIVGRQKEFGELQRRLNAAIAGECQFAIVAGETGIGKSRLLDELESLAKAKDVRVLHGRFVEQDQAFPYQGFCEVIQEYFRSKTKSSSGSVDFIDLAPELVSLFPMLKEIEEVRAALTGTSGPSPTAEPRKAEDRTYIFELLASTIIRLAAGKPLVLLFEELHSADVSVEALQYVVRRLGPTPTLIVGTYRPAEVIKRHPVIRMIDSFQGDRRFVQIRLEPFLPSEHRIFLEALIGSSDLDHGFVDKLYEATEGNPYFTKELVRSLIDSGRIIKTETGSWNLSGETALSPEALPPTIQQTVQRRIEGLSKELREILSVASILGKSFEFRDLEMLAEEKSDIEEAVDKLVEDGFIEEERESRGDRFVFSSGVVREVLYAGLSPRKRRLLHRKYAEELEKKHAGRLERIYSQLLHHYAQGNVPEKVVDYGLKLARRSLEAFSLEDAVRVSRTVLASIEQEDRGERPVEAETRVLLAEALRMMGNIDGALQELEKGVRIFKKENQTNQLVNTIVAAADTAWEGRRVEETRKWVETGLTEARTGGELTSLPRLLSLGATIANLRGEYEKAKEYLEEAETFQSAKQHTKEEIPAGGTLVVAIPAPIGVRHPVDMNLNEEFEIFSNVFETLVATDSQGNLIPHLCEKWEASEEGKSFLFTIRKNVRMHNGQELTAKDIKSCFEKSIRHASDLPSAFLTIRGVSEFLKGSIEEVDGIRAPSAEKLEIQLLEALPIYPAFLLDGKAGVVLESKQGPQDELSLAGTGPFRLESLKNNLVKLKRNEDYWKGSSPLLDGIEFHAGLSASEIAEGFRSGQFDVVRDLHPEDLEEILRDRRLRAGLVESPKKNVYFALFNSASPIVQIQTVRQALCGIVRSHDLVRGTLGRFAQPAEGFLPPGILGHDPGRRRHPETREKALELLESSKVPLPIHLKASVHPIFQDRYASLTKALFEVWSDIGVNISIETSTMASYLEAFKKNEKFDLMIGRWNADYDDPDNFTYVLFHSNAGLYRFYSSKELDRLMEEARSEGRSVVREKLYRRIEALLLESSYLLPLFHDVDYRIANPRVLRLTLRSSAPFVNYSELGKSETATPAIGRKSGGGTIHVPFTGEIHDLDPSMVSRVVEAELVPNIFETLTKETEGARIIPWLASEFRAEEGGRSFWFRLREDVRFHDGRRMTARDVRYSFERLLQKEDCPNRHLFSRILGAEEVLSNRSRELKGIQIISASEFRMHLDRPISFFPALLAYIAGAILPEGADRFTGTWREGCVGTGPFRVARFDPGKRLELEANPYYWRQGYPRSDGLVFTLGVSPQDLLSGFRAGRYSIASELLPQDVETLRHDSEYASRYRETPRLSTYYVVLNSHRGPLTDESLRHSFVQSVDVDSLVRRRLGRLGIPAHGFIPPGLLGYEPQRTNISHAEQPIGAKSNELTCIVNSIYKGPYASLAHDLFDACKKKGFDSRVLDIKFEDYNRTIAAAPSDIALERWISDYSDSDNFVGLLHSENGLYGRFCGTPEIDRLIEKGQSETDPEMRHEIYRDIEEIIARKALLLPLFHEQTYRFARPEVEGFEITFFYPAVPYEKLSIRR